MAIAQSCESPMIRACAIKEVPAFEIAISLCDREGEEQWTMGTGESPSICLGRKEKKHREHLQQKLLQLWCPALNINPPAGNDTDHKIHLCVVNAEPPSSGFRCTRRCLCRCPRCRHSFCCWQWWRCCPTVSGPWEHCSAHCQPCLAALQGASAASLGWEQLHDLAECLKQFKINVPGKNKYTCRRLQLQRYSHFSLLSCLSSDRLSVGWGVEKEEQGWGVNKANDSWVQDSEEI